jgi:hypothetical protein
VRDHLHHLNHDWKERLEKSMPGVDTSLMDESLDQIKREADELKALLKKASALAKVVTSAPPLERKPVARRDLYRADVPPASLPEPEAHEAPQVIEEVVTAEHPASPTEESGPATGFVNPPPVIPEQPTVKPEPVPVWKPLFSTPPPKDGIHSTLKPAVPRRRPVVVRQTEPIIETPFTDKDFPDVEFTSGELSEKSLKDFSG